MSLNHLNSATGVPARSCRHPRLLSARAVWVRAIPRVYVYFSKPLHPEPLIEANWIVVVNGQRQTLQNAMALSTHVQIDTTPGAPRPGGPFVTYTAAIQELQDVDMLFVAPFLRFPITVI